MKEQWRDIPGFEGRYQVSNTGKVKSLPRWVNAGPAPGKRFLKERILRVCKKGVRGYHAVHLQPEDEVITIHKLVMLAFVGPCPEGMEVCHRDDDADNNSLSNLRYGTHASNFSDIKMKRSSNGRFVGGHRNVQ